MKINRIDGSLVAPVDARPVRGVAVDEPPGGSLPARLGAALSSPDPAGALRVLVEEIRSELQARLGAAATLPPARPDPLDADSAATTLLRYLRLAGRAGEPPLPAESVRDAVEAGVGRARAVLASLGRIPPSAQAAVDDVVARLRAATANPAPRPAAPPALQELPQALVREVAGTLADRIGMLPRPTTVAAAPRDLREALALMSGQLGDIAADSAVAVRASPRVVETALREGVQRAIASLAAPGRADPALSRLASDFTALALRLAANPGTLLPPAPREPAAVRGLVAGEFRQVLAEWTAEARAAPAPAPAPAPASSIARALGAMAMAAAEMLLRAPATEAAALRAILESSAERALARSLLQLPGGAAQAPLRAAAEELHAAFRALLAAADSAAVGRGLDVRGLVALLAQAGEALQADGHPPFRFDLPVGRAGLQGRRAARVGRQGSVEAIESSDPGDDPPEGESGPAGPPLWPKPPAG